jgi:predicted dehydrogenase
MQKIGIIMNGVTGRMGTNQHLLRSIKAICDQGGIKNDQGDTIMPEAVLVGRNHEKLKKLSEQSGFSRYTTDLDSVLSDPQYSVYFDAQTTNRRVEAVKLAILAGKHVYCEKPVADNLHAAIELHELAENAGVKSGVVQDKLWLPGLIKLKKLIDSDFFGKILSVKGDFGYWVFEGFTRPAQRPSWNYRKEDGGGIIIDMLCHWRYVLDNLFGNVKAVSCQGMILIPERIDEKGEKYDCTADDAAYATFELENGIMAQFNSSWVTRVRRDDLLVLQVDGTKGSAIAGLRDVVVQDYEMTPTPVWNPDEPKKIDFYSGWKPVYDEEEYDNAFKIQWELFLRHIVWDEPFRWNLMEGAKGVQLADAGIESWKQRKWISLDTI